MEGGGVWAAATLSAREELECGGRRGAYVCPFLGVGPECYPEGPQSCLPSLPPCNLSERQRDLSTTSLCPYPYPSAPPR